MEAEPDTFVAFVDISGFKSYLDRGEGRLVLDDFYSIGAKIVDDYNDSRTSHDPEIKGLLVSDCAILYISEEMGIHEKQWPFQLLSMLDLIRKYNIEMIDRNHLLTCSIACGPCDYEPRMDNRYIRKNSLMGQGYVRAFTDNEYGLPKIQPSQCRIVTEGLLDYPPIYKLIIDDVFDFDGEDAFLSDHNNIVKSKNGKHLYYYWMLDDDTKLEQFVSEIKDENKKMYEGIKNVIKRYVSEQNGQD